MKKLILLFLLFYSFAYSQDFDLTANQTNGKFSLATNNTTFMGIASGSVAIPNFFDASASIDTSLWGLMPNQTNGKYSIAYNKTTFMSKDSGTVVIPVYFGSNSSSSSVDTSLIPFLNQNNTFTGAINTFTGKMVVGTGTSNGTADFLAMGDTITLRGTVYRDSSYLRVEVNPFSQRLKVSMISKTAGNMMTWDSTSITTSLAITSTSTMSSTNTITGNNFISTGSTGYRSAGTGIFNWNGRSILSSSADGIVDFFSSDATTRARLIFGTATITAPPTYADNTAALAGGLTAGQIYVTSAGVLMRTY